MQRMHENRGKGGVEIDRQNCESWTFQLRTFILSIVKVFYFSSFRKIIVWITLLVRWKECFEIYQAGLETRRAASIDDQTIRQWVRSMLSFQTGRYQWTTRKFERRKSWQAFWRLAWCKIHQVNLYTTSILHRFVCINCVLSFGDPELDYGRYKQAKPNPLFAYGIAKKNSSIIEEPEPSWLLDTTIVYSLYSISTLSYFYVWM